MSSVDNVEILATCHVSPRASSLAIFWPRRHPRKLSLPGQLINHTTFYPLRYRSIALGIETKKTSEGWDGATLQMGVWQSADWSLLRTLTNITRANDRPLRNLEQMEHPEAERGNAHFRYA
ncbi:hypothetical protein EDB80DRAFT_690335 [Ilyonectria destructans]|nr:hypothetical protein EDB80DRAFT_690335 [Ilyonectria destructans]